MMLTTLLILTLFGGDKVGDLIEAERYLDAGALLRPPAHHLESPEAVRRYTSFLTTSYAYQVGFRTFFVRNLQPGERLELLRKMSSPVKVSADSAIIEDNFEALLLKAEEKWPDNLDIRFAKAVFAFNGRCCVMQPKIHMTMKEILATFEEAHKAGIESTTSQFALGVSLIKPKDRERATQLLRKAHLAAPLDADIQYAWLNDLLANKHYDEAVKQGRFLFESTVNPEMKADALTGVARAFQAKKDYPNAQIAVDSGLKMRPGDPFLWMIGLENLRKMRDPGGYSRYIFEYLDRNRESPEPFRRYLDFIRFKKYHPFDETFLEAYKGREEESPLAQVIQRYNLGALYQMLARPAEAAPHFQAALDLAKKLETPPPAMLDTIQKRLNSVTPSKQPEAQ